MQSKGVIRGKGFCLEKQMKSFNQLHLFTYSLAIETQSQLRNTIILDRRVIKMKIYGYLDANPLTGLQWQAGGR